MQLKIYQENAIDELLTKSKRLLGYSGNKKLVFKSPTGSGKHKQSRQYLYSGDLLEHFIRRCLLKKYDIETIEYLNKKFKEMNQKGIYSITDLKCNFDVEISRDMCKKSGF